MINGYCKSRGKRPLEKEEDRTYYDVIPDSYNGDFQGRLKQGYLKLDIDDFDHRTGAIVDSIKGIARSEAIKAILDNKGYKYNLIITENGKQFYFKVPNNLIDSNKINWYSPIGVKCEWKLGGGTSKEHVPIKVNGVIRDWVKGSIDNETIDYLPVFLYPLQKSKHKPFDLEIASGGRNNALSEYAFYLSNKGYSAEDIDTIIRLMNQYILDEPLSEKEIDIILRPETIDKLKSNENQKAEKNLSHVAVGDEVIKKFDVISFNDNLYSYDAGVYLPISKEKLNSYVTLNYPSAKINFKREVIEYVKGKTFRELDGIKTDYINVKNGLLKITGEQVELIPHSKDVVQFSQFNASYDPDAKCEILDDMLLKVFNHSSEQIELFEQMIGYLLMNHVDYQKCFFLTGLPSSGKSTIIKMISHFCDKRNVSSVDLNAFNKRFAVAEIVGKIANIVADRQKHKIETSGVFKSLVTGDGVEIERKYQSSFTYYNTAKLIYGMNHYPDFSNDFEGVERRVVFIDFKRTFKETDSDFNPHMEQDLSTDLCMSALLNRAIKGYISLVKNKGFIKTEDSESATREFAKENDNVLRWIEEMDIYERLESEPIKNGHVGLYPEYQAYCINIGENAKAQKDFSRTICSKYNLESHRKRIDGVRIPFFRKK